MIYVKDVEYRVVTLFGLNVVLDIRSKMSGVGSTDKGGVEPSGATDLVRHIQQQCPALVLTGLMTIGAYNYSVADGPNPDFQVSSGRPELLYSAAVLTQNMMGCRRRLEVSAVFVP